MLIAKKDIRNSLSVIPESPGVYIYRDKEDKVLYVGKAKNLRKRVGQYFQRESDRPNARAMLRVFETVEYIVVQTETDALLLENNLIKTHQPPYNIMLKHGNFYPYIYVTRERFPRFGTTHKPQPGGSTEYYGPYPNKSMAYQLVLLFRRLYKFRTCSFNLSPENIERGKFRVCLKYHIGRCKGPCEGLQTEEDYDRDVRAAKEILRGHITEVKRDIKEVMARASEELDFETALQMQNMLYTLENYQGKSTIMSNVIGDALVATYGSSRRSFFVNYLLTRDGRIISGRTMEYRRGIEEDEEELFASVLKDLLDTLPLEGTRELILPLMPEYLDLSAYRVTIPQRGDRKHILDLSQHNVDQFIKDKDLQAEKLNPAQHNMQILRDLQSSVGLPTLPWHVECFDNSNIQGADPVAACVVFKGGVPSKKDYRLYHIKTVEGPDDYASMHEVVVRRYSRLRDEGEELPDLIITDGGKGQMSVVREALEEVGVEIPILGLAKDDRHRTSEVLYGDPPQVIGIMQRGQVFHLLERIQNEVHRFAITFHRNVHAKKSISSELDAIAGIGSATQKKLIRTFKSVKRIRESVSLDELTEAIGPAKARLVWDYFHPDSEA